MRHMLFAASIGGVLCVTTPAVNAQTVPSPAPVPGRALLDFPLGTLGEVPALAGSAGGLFNPAAIVVGAPFRLRAAAAHLDAPRDRGASGEVVSVVGARGRSALGVGIARMGVSGLERTGDGDTQVLGSIPYYTYVASLTGAYRIGGPLGGHVALAAAARYRAAHADTVDGSTSALDVGVLADRLAGKADARVALSTYLWRPGKEDVELPGVHFGADARVAGPDDAHEARVGLAYDATRGGTSEKGLYVSGRWRIVEARGGVAQAVAFGTTQTRTRIGVGFHAARFTVGVGNESSDPGFGPMWQFTLSTQLK